MRTSLADKFIETSEKYPNKTAIIDGDREITFGDLYNTSLFYASEIRKLEKFDLTPQPIAVFMDKCIESIATNLAILICGDYYMNLDTKTPSNRIANILTCINPTIIITDDKHYNIISKITNVDIKILNIDTLESGQPYNVNSIAEKRLRLIDTDPSCIINTSGSTGTPKGVVLNHRSFFDFIDWSIDTFSLCDDLVIGSLSPMVFDIYSYELCMLMFKAATIVVLPANLSAFPAKIISILEERKVNFIFWVPTIMVNIANMDLLSQYRLETLKLVWFAGEVFPTKQFNYWYHKLPHTIFANLYGPIEITLDCTYYIINRDIPDSEPIPIGQPCRNTGILILDEHDYPVTSPGREGELCVRGSSLAMGYYNNKEKTEAVFTQNPLNKSYIELIYRTGDIVSYNDNMEIVFKGRKDNLVKHLGYRTDLGEIEHVIINKIKLIKNGCVIYNHKTKDITLYYESNDEISNADFRKLIGMELPKYMIPTVYRREIELKRNTNGKIDRLYYNNLVNA